MFGVGIPEMLVIVVVAIVVFGPDRLPEFARQAGRLLRQVRKFAQSAQSDLRNELGPDYADLKLTDLDPRVAIRKHILEAMDDDETGAQDRMQQLADQDQNGSPTHQPLAADERPPYDLEAT